MAVVEGHTLESKMPLCLVVRAVCVLIGMTGKEELRNRNGKRGKSA